MPTVSRTRSLRIALVVAVVLALTLLAACSSSGGGGSSSGDIQMKNLAFKVSAPVKTGATVTAKNNDDVEHTVTADDGSFNVTVEPGKTATFTAPGTAGDYKFHCNIHSQMHGTLTVQ